VLNTANNSNDEEAKYEAFVSLMKATVLFEAFLRLGMARKARA
jgi:hypothetical protein